MQRHNAFWRHWNIRINQYQKSDQAQLIIHVNLECIIEKTGACKNDPENSSTEKVSEHIP